MPSFLAQATQHVPLLDGQVDRDKTVPPLVDGDFITFQGSLNPTGKVIAIKRPRFLSRDDKEMELVLHGIIIWSLLHHENINPLVGVATFDNGLSTVTELMVRGDANSYVQDPQVDPRPLLLGIAHGLRYLHHGHALGPIYHGDMRGRNVLVAPDGRALLTGFHYSFISNPPLDMTLTSTVVGALRWMAPEGIDGGRATAERDVWAFAMTTLELFTRKVPFPHIGSESGLIIRILSGKPDYPTGMSDMWQNLCTSCWELDPGLRPDMMTIVSRIEEVCVLTVDCICG
ncbi:hypothetical protein SCLCIDRAFT_26660 [Scleroderma citrinum Foug A]|uniref:Protein kinase domain-containing protein n=1 Tax=Scleroderma citrinum Foug A TaxID=1036808 RepID=A0A0C2ZEZ6_9AGAM|nr:hypothetical protein SCLCIDRAFT_26660 [Scleroderma citrinum Foug A]